MISKIFNRKLIAFILVLLVSLISYKYLVSTKPQAKPLKVKELKHIIKLDNSKDHYPAAILKSDLAYIKVKCDRGKRYKGKSKMSISKLALHGLNGMSFFVEIVLVRFFILSIIGMIFSLLIIISVILLKINNLIGVLNWATNTTIGFAILFVIFLLIGFLSLLNLLNRNISKKEEEENNLNELIKKITTF